MLALYKEVEPFFYGDENTHAPYIEYQFVVQEVGKYELELYMQPSNPVRTDYTLFCGIQANGDDIATVNVLPEEYRVDDENWAVGVLNNIHKHTITIKCNTGLNTLRIYAMSPGVVLKNLLIYPKGKKPAKSYLWPTETYYAGK
jgi:Gylcosyl hydrolase family 115 C-terminal domain